MTEETKLTDTDPSQPNTCIDYQYIDGSNCKQSKAIIVAGHLTFEELKPYLDEGEYFIPGQVGMEDLQHLFGGQLTKNDHPWHKLQEGDLEPTSDLPTVAYSAKELLERFKTVTWDDVSANKALGIPY